MKQKQDLTQGIIWKQVILFFIPLLIGAFFQHLYTIIDTIIIGKALGTTQLSAVGGSATKLIVLYTNFFVGVSSGITAYASRFYGEKNYEKLRNLIFNGTLFFAVFGLILAILGIVLSPQYFTLLNTPENTLADATLYLHTYLCGLIFTVLYNTFAGILRALGDSQRPLYVLMFCSVMNISLDIFFTYQLSLGVFGIALATVLSQGTSALILGYLLLRTMKELDQSKAKIQLLQMKEIATLGIPAGIQSIMYSISNMAVQSGINSFGASSVAAWTAYGKLDSIADLFLSSLASTVLPFVGQNLGANKLERAKKAVWQIMGMSFLFLSTLIALFIWQKDWLLGLFTYDLEVISIGGQVMWVLLPMYILGIPQQIFSQALRGMGLTFMPMILTLVGVVGLRFGWLAIVMPLSPSLPQLGLVYPLSSLLMSTVFSIYYAREIKKLK